MQSAIVLFAVLAVASAANVIQYAGVPQVGLGNTVVSSARLGGNFAYTVGTPGYTTGYTGYPAGYTAGYPVGYNNGYGYVAAAPQVVYPAASNVQTVGVKAPVATQYYTAGTTVVAGTPANTYKTVAGVSPLAYNTVGYTGLGYNGLGYNGLGYNGVNYGYTGYPTGYTTVV